MLFGDESGGGDYSSRRSRFGKSIQLQSVSAPGEIPHQAVLSSDDPINQTQLGGIQQRREQRVDLRSRDSVPSLCTSSLADATGRVKVWKHR